LKGAFRRGFLTFAFLTILLVSSISPVTAKSVKTVGVGNEPYYNAYDPVSHYVFVTNFLSGTVSILKGSSVVGTITLPTNSEPEGIAVDSANNYIYVADYNLNQVYVIGKVPIFGYIVIKTITDSNFCNPQQVAYAPSSATIWVTNYCTAGDVTIIRGLNVLTDIGYNGLWGFQDALALGYSEPGNLMYISFGDSVLGFPAVAVVYTCCGNMGNLIETIVAGSTAVTGIAFDPSDLYMYMANPGSNNVDVINATDYTPLTTINFGTKAPNQVAFDPTSLQTWVTGTQCNCVTELSGTTAVKTLTHTGGLTPLGIAYDSASNTMYVANYGSDNVGLLKA
jgi:YVTN family beta-propeller protein